MEDTCKETQLQDKHHFIERIGRDVKTGVVYYNVIFFVGLDETSQIFEVYDQKTYRWKFIAA